MGLNLQCESRSPEAEPIVSDHINGEIEKYNLTEYSVWDNFEEYIKRTFFSL